MSGENNNYDIYEEIDKKIKILEKCNKLLAIENKDVFKKIDLKNLYKLKEIINEIELNKIREYANPSQLRDSGIILSYGIGDDFIPAGTYSISGFVDKNKQLITKKINDIFDVYIEFTEVEYIKSVGTKNKVYGSKIYIPYLEFIKLCKKYSNDNTNELGIMLGETQKNIDLLAYFEKIAEDYMSGNLGIYSYDSINFNGKSMEDINCEFSNREKLRGNNFKVIPFSFGIVKKLLKKKYKENVEEKEYEIDEIKTSSR